MSHAAERIGLTAGRAGRMFLAVLALALLAVVLLLSEAQPNAAVGQSENGKTLVVEHVAKKTATPAVKSTSATRAKGSRKSNTGNACNNPTPARKNPNCRSNY